MSSSYAYYSQAPAWGTQGYQMSSPPEPSYAPQSSWGGLDYYRAQFGGSGIDDSLYNNAWNRLQGLGGNMGGIGGIGGMGGVPIGGMGGMGIGGMGGMGSVGGPMGGMRGMGGIGGVGGMGGMGGMGGVGGMGMGGIGGMEGMGATEAAGIGKAQAKYWHRRIYGALTDLRMVLPVHLGAAAAYEAWRAWKRHSTILSQPLGGSRPRQREALIGLAVGEAARLFTYAGRQMDQAGQMQVTEIAAMIASRIFTESWGLEEGALGMGVRGGFGVSGITGPGGLPPRARSLSPYRAAPSLSDRVSEEVAAERVAEEVAANAERGNMPRISPRPSPILSQGGGMGINAGVPGSLNEGMPVVPGGMGVGSRMGEAGVPGAGYNMPGPFPGGFAPSGGGIGPGAMGQGYGPEMMRGRYGLGPGGGGMGLGGGMPGYGPYGASSGSTMGYGGGYGSEMQGYAGIPRQSEPPVVIHMHKPRRRRSHSRHRHRRHRSLSPSYGYDDGYRGSEYGYGGGYGSGIRI